MPEDQDLRVALVGCGNIGLKAHLPAYARIPDVVVVAVCDTDERLVAAAAELTEAVPYTDLADVLSKEDVDIVDICTPPSTHAKLSIQAMEAERHVLCEKPIAHTLEDADAMIESARVNGVKLMIGQTRRFDHRYVAMKEQIDAGRVGQPVFIRRAERQFLPCPADAWYWDPALGGGVILDIGIHVLDLFRWMFGQEPVEVRAVAKAVHQAAQKAAQKAGSFDYAMITCKFADGGIGFAETSWAHPSTFGSGLYASLDVVGTQGKLEYSDRGTNPMLVFDEESGAEFPRYFALMSSTEHAFEAQIVHFLDSVRNGSSFAVDAHDARVALSMALAAQQSAMTDQVVTLPATVAHEDISQENVTLTAIASSSEEISA